MMHCFLKYCPRNGANCHKEPHIRRGDFLLVMLTLLFCVLSTFRSEARTFNVNSSIDVNDLTPGNDLCVAYLIVFPPYVLPFCTLRAAIEESNALPGPDEIVLPPGFFALSLTGINEDSSRTGDLDITDSLTITGAGSDQTFIDAAGIDRVFDLIEPGTEVTITGVTISNGLLQQSPDEPAEGGGGIKNMSSLSLSDVVLSGNHVHGPALGNIGGGLLNTATCSITTTTVKSNSAEAGGGIYNSATGALTIDSSTIKNNNAAFGAGLLNEGSMDIVNSTLSGNSALRGDQSLGGGLLNRGQMDIIQGTVAANSAAGYGGGIGNEGVLTLTNTLIAGNNNGNCSSSATIISLGSNLDSDGSCLLNGPTDLAGVNPRISSLGYNGGSTETHVPLLGSPAIDQGKNLLAEGITTDQRGSARPQGGGFDIGACETTNKSLVPLLIPLLLNTVP